ncbi:MAG: DUF438 domain-containing protein [Tissierellia bacterium]|nr:DUF438 domain-containing protein [Tissierellia bacterium]
MDKERIELLKSFIGRLTEGEDLESVRKDFVENFESVDAGEIAKAEQELISQGTPISEVQKLCDVHSALFHGKTKDEQIANAERAVMESLSKEGESPKLRKGHPARVFMDENEKIISLIEDARKNIDSKEVLELVGALRGISLHYQRKGDLIYPLLNRTYGYTGPSNVMWGVDDEIRYELRLLAQKAGEDSRERLEAVLTRAEEMVYKENNILFPLCLKNFTEEEWMRIYYEMPAYETILEGYPLWGEAEAKREDLKTIGGKLARDYVENIGEDEYITLGSGHMKKDQIEWVLNTIPMELTFIDENNINRYYDRGEKVFKRPDMSIGRDVFSCHPKKIADKVKMIVEGFKKGESDSVNLWMEKNGETLYISYMAVRNEEGKYLGTLETVQNMEFAKKYFKNRKEV